jgi:hypothetical protein
VCFSGVLQWCALVGCFSGVPQWACALFYLAELVVERLELRLRCVLTRHALAQLAMKERTRRLDRVCRLVTRLLQRRMDHGT